MPERSAPGTPSPPSLEVVPVGVEIDVPEIDDLKYQQPSEPAELLDSDELLEVRLAYKQPDASRDDESTYLKVAVRDGGAMIDDASPDFQFAAAAAAFGMMLRNSPDKGETTWEMILDLATAGAQRDAHGDRAEFIELVGKARTTSER